MIFIKFIEELYLKYNGPIPRVERQIALFGGKETRYECARAGSMVRHYSVISQRLIQTIGKLGSHGVANMQRHFHKQELRRLLAKRRGWKLYRQKLGNCANG